MRYENISTTLQRKGLSNEPAFQSVRYVLEDIPCDKGSCPLGLYDPEHDTIILPPKFLEGALLHELGHRYEDFYYGGDLSEVFAEDYRRKYSNGGKVLLAFRPASEFHALAAFEPLYKEGDRGAVEMRLSCPPDESTLYALSQYPQLRYAYGADFLRVEFTKSMPFLPIILGVGTVLIAGMLGFGVFKIEEEIKKLVLPLSLIAAGTLLLYGLATRR